MARKKNKFNKWVLLPLIALIGAIAYFINPIRRFFVAKPTNIKTGIGVLTARQKLLKEYPMADAAIGINYRALKARNLPFSGMALRSTLNDIKRFPNRQKDFENQYFKKINYTYSTVINHARILGYNV